MKDSKATMIDQKDWYRIASTVFHEVGHVLGLSDAYARETTEVDASGNTTSRQNKPSKEGSASRTLKAGKSNGTDDVYVTSNYNYVNPSIMLQTGDAPSAYYSNDVQKLVASIVTGNYQQYQGYTQPPSGVKTTNVYDWDGTTQEGNVAIRIYPDYIGSSTLWS